MDDRGRFRLLLVRVGVALAAATGGGSSPCAAAVEQQRQRVIDSVRGRARRTGAAFRLALPAALPHAAKAAREGAHA